MGIKETLVGGVYRPLRRQMRCWQRSKRAKKLFRDMDLKYNDKEYLQEIQGYWKSNFGKRVNPIWHFAATKVTGKKDVRFIPDNIWKEYLLPKLNSTSIWLSYNDKNLSDIFFGACKQPLTVVKKIDGYFYDQHKKYLSAQNAGNIIFNGPTNQVIKPSQTSSGYGIRALDIEKERAFLDGIEVSWEEIDRLYGNNYIVQERVKQHPVMAEPHPSSANTVRLATIKWAGEVSVMMAFARFGINQAINDNAGTGGICCGIDQDGKLHDNAIDEAGRIYTEHPNTGFSFKDRQTYIPGYEKICKAGIELHQNMFHFHIASWDFVVGIEGEPILLEVNFKGASWIYQFACRAPLFGDTTEDILAYVKRKSKN